jgi:hypothetical protein
MLKENGSVSNLKKIYDFYKAYGKLTMLLKTNKETPGRIYFPEIKLPKYLKWAEQYMVVKGKRIKK